LSSANNQSGDRFTARVVEPVLLNGRVAIAVPTNNSSGLILLPFSEERG